MSDVSLEIENQSYSVEVESSTETSTNNITVSYDTTNTVQISSPYVPESASNASDIVGLRSFISDYIFTTSGLYESSSPSIMEIGISGVETSQINGLTSSASQLNYLDLSVPIGETEASKALVLDSSSNISGINNIWIDGTATINTLSIDSIDLNDLSVQNSFINYGEHTAKDQINIGYDNSVFSISSSGFRVFTNPIDIDFFEGSIYQSLIWVDSNNRWEFYGGDNPGDVYTQGEFIGSFDGGTP